MEDFVTFEIAKKLKEKGFNCKYPFAMYDKYEQFCPLYSSDKHCFKIDNFFAEHDCIAPTISQVFKWLREEMDIDIVVEPINGNTVFMSGEKYMVSIYNMRKRDYKIHRENKDKYVSWKEAALGGIQYVLDNNAKNWKL